MSATPLSSPAGSHEVAQAALAAEMSISIYTLSAHINIHTECPYQYTHCVPISIYTLCAYINLLWETRGGRRQLPRARGLGPTQLPALPKRERCQVGPKDASWPMHSCGNTAPLYKLDLLWETRGGCDSLLQACGLGPAQLRCASLPSPRGRLLSRRTARSISARVARRG